MAMRRGQVSAFIIAGILILFLFVSVFAIVKVAGPSKERALTPDSYTQECLRLGTQKALQVLARHSSVPLTLEPVTLKGPSDQTLCVEDTTYEAKMTLDDLQTITDELPPLIIKYTDRCVGDFGPITKQGYQVERTGTPKATLTFSPKDAVVEMDFPLSFTRQGQVTDLDTMFLSLPSHFKGIHTKMRVVSSIYAAKREVPLEVFNRDPQPLLATPTKDGPLLIAVDQASNLYQPVNYTFVLR